MREDRRRGPGPRGAERSVGREYFWQTNATDVLYSAIPRDSVVHRPTTREVVMRDYQLAERRGVASVDATRVALDARASCR